MPDDERPLAPKQIADLAADQNERGRHERLDRHRRLNTAHRRIQVVNNRRDGHVHERRVDHEHEHRRRQKDPLTRNATRAFSRNHAHRPPRATALRRHSRLDKENRDPIADPGITSFYRLGFHTVNVPRRAALERHHGRPPSPRQRAAASNLERAPSDHDQPSGRSSTPSSERVYGAQNRSRTRREAREATRASLMRHSTDPGDARSLKQALTWVRA